MPNLRPVLFAPHGSPMFALHPGAAGKALRGLTGRLQRPRAIVVVSPHWETSLPTVGTCPAPATLHDFGGFDPALHTLQYPAPGAAGVAAQVAAALANAGLRVLEDAQRGLDHGAWVPLRYLFPAAELPVIPLSIQHHEGPRHAYRVGQALSPLVSEDILVLCSGNLTHNLRDWQQASQLHLPTPDYVHDFTDWIQARLAAGEVDALLDYRTRAPGGVQAHPRDEHLLPLFTALGAAGPEAVPAAFFRGVSDHVIAMDGYVFH